MSENLCPVCSYSLDLPAWNKNSPSEEICPCCGIQFGYDDCAGGDAELRVHLYSQLRKKWIDKGMRWHSSSILAPKNWNPLDQLASHKPK